MVPFGPIVTTLPPVIAISSAITEDEITNPNKATDIKSLDFIIFHLLHQGVLNGNQILCVWIGHSNRNEQHHQ